MRRIINLPVIVLAVLLTSCGDRLKVSECQDSAGVGEVVLSIRTDASLTESKAGGDDILIDDFRVEIFNSSSIRLYRKNFGEARDEAISLNSGNYRLLAKYGDSLGVGFGKPFYLADVAFPVRPGQKETVEATAKLANVKIAMDFGDNLVASCPDFYAVVRHTATYVKSSLKFLKNETRAGYIPGGELVVELYADLEGNGKWKYYSAPAQVFAPNDFVTFRIDTGASYGDLVVNVLVDNSVEQIDKTIEIPFESASAPAPEIEPVGFAPDGRYSVIDGDDVQENAYFSVNAPGTAVSCILEINSPYLSSLGVPASVDLLSADAAILLAPSGIWTGGDAAALAVDLTGFAGKLAGSGLYSESGQIAASVSLTVRDENGRSSSSEVNFEIVRPKGEILVADADVWATKIVRPGARMTSEAGIPSKMTLEYSSDGTVWFEIPSEVSGNDLAAGTVTGLAPGTTYRFRLMYGGLYAVDSKSFTTEPAAQVGNAGFEEWTATQWHTTYLYEPFSGVSSQWWDVNSKVSMPDQSYLTYPCFKCMPTVTYCCNTVHSGAAAAQVSTINVGMWNSVLATNGTWYVGELFIGDADSDGNRVSTGHTFPSRPSAVTFWYQFSAYSSDDRFGVEVAVNSADGTVLASAVVSDGPLADSWTKMTLPLEYVTDNQKAASISISFKASTLGSHSCNAGGNWIEIAGSTGSGDSKRVKLSSMLRLDDIELVY